jgi:hypothetical protein
MRVHIPPFACPCCGETITIVRLRIEDDVVDGVEMVAGVAGWPKSPWVNQPGEIPWKS